MKVTDSFHFRARLLIRTVICPWGGSGRWAVKVDNKACSLLGRWLLPEAVLVICGLYFIFVTTRWKWFPQICFRGFWGKPFFYWLKLGQAGELPREPCWLLSDDWMQPCRTNHSEAQSFPPPRPRRRVPSWKWSSGANSKQPSPTFRTLLFQWCCPHRIACCPSETLWSRCRSWWPRGLGLTSWDKAYQSQGRQNLSTKIASHIISAPALGSF